MGRKPEYFLMLTPCGFNAAPLFMGPFDQENDALQVLRIEGRKLEIVLDEQKPLNPSKAIRAIILTKTEAKRRGLEILGEGYGPNRINSVPEFDLWKGIVGDSQGNSNKQSCKPAFLENGRKVFILTPYYFTIQWLKSLGIEGEVIDRIKNAEQVRDAVIVGSKLPYSLASKAYCFGQIYIPGLESRQSGEILSPEEMEEAGAEIHWYQVSKMQK